MVLSSYDAYVLRGAPIGATRAKLLQQRHGRIDKKYVVLPFKNGNFCIYVTCILTRLVPGYPKNILFHTNARHKGKDTIFWNTLSELPMH